MQTLKARDYLGSLLGPDWAQTRAGNAFVASPDNDSAALPDGPRLTPEQQMALYRQKFGGVVGDFDNAVQYLAGDNTMSFTRGTGKDRMMNRATVGPDGKITATGWRPAPQNSAFEDFVQTGLPVLAAPLLAGAAFGGAAGAAGGAGAGAGAGFVGEGVASGVGAWDAAMGGSMLGSGGAVGGAAGGLSGVAGGAASGGSGMLSNIASSLGMSTGDLVRGGFGLVDSLLGAKASRDAARAQIDASRESNALLRDMWQTTRKDNMPALQARNNGLAGYQGLLKDPSSVTKTPGYAFRMGEGQKLLEGSAAARGGLYSGATLKRLSRYGQDYATSEYDNALNRYGRLAGMGESGAGTVANAGSNYGNQAANNITSAGNARGAGIVGSYNALSNGFNNWQQGMDERAILRRYGFGG